MNTSKEVKKVIIVGGVAGGANAAARLRRLNERLEILMFERSGYVSFANCGLPYHIGDEIQDRKKLLLHTPSTMKKLFNLDVRVNSEVVSIDRNAKQVVVSSLLDHRQYVEDYDVLILATGAAPIKPQIEGLGLPGIFTLRNVEDMDSIISHLDKSAPKNVLIVGGGFIGIEMLEQLNSRLKDQKPKLTLVEMSPHILPPLDFEMATQLEEHIRSKNVDLITGDPVVAFKKIENEIHAVTRNGKTIIADIVFFNIGVRPEIGLAKNCGLEIGERGGIKVDSQLRTSDPFIYAVGDCIETKNLITNKYGLTPLAGPANRQGRVVADVICGIDSQYKGSIGTAIVRVFELTAAVTGVNERILEAAGFDFEVIYLHGRSHASYYPDSHPIHLKILYSKESRKILGAQAVGRDGVDKRIDVLATALHTGMTIDDLIDLELCYAPPFGSAKDPINMAGMIAENILENLVKSITPKELDSLEVDYTLLDVRDLQEHMRGSIEGSLHIPLADLRSRISELPKDKIVIVYCQSGQRSYNACRILSQNGFICKNLSGAFGTWQLYNASRDTHLRSK